jgi:hypothetical protein
MQYLSSVASIGSAPVNAYTAIDEVLSALLGSVLHASSGLSPAVLMEIWNTYVVPRFLYGLEVQNPTQTDIKKLEQLQRKVCRPTVAFVSQLLRLAWQFQKISLYNIYPVLLLLVLLPSMHRQHERLKMGRQTMYALLGSGLHARSGMSPVVLMKIWNTYVVPRFLYGLEVQNPTKTDIKKLEQLQRKVCRQFQCYVVIFLRHTDDFSFSRI